MGAEQTGEPASGKRVGDHQVCVRGTPGVGGQRHPPHAVLDLVQGAGERERITGQLCTVGISLVLPCCG